MDFILEVIVRILSYVILIVILLPIFIVIATPFILIGSAFSSQPYFSATKDGFWNTVEIWKSVATNMPCV